MVISLQLHFKGEATINMTKQIYDITAKVSCVTNGTAFFIDDKHAITARHCVEKNIIDGQVVKLSFFDANGLATERSARVVSSDIQFDIALLELIDPVVHIKSWLHICVDEIKKTDNWETVGYPENWNEAKGATNYCYIDGSIHYVNNFEQQTIYDIHLVSDLIKEDWPYALGGLSGSPLIINEKICGIIVNEENSVIKSQLKAVSFKKCESFFMDSPVKVLSSFQSSNPILKRRLEKQTESCKDFFEKVNNEKDNQGMNLSINPYYLKYHENKSKLGQLAKYLAAALNQYLCDLNEIIESSLDPMKYLAIHKKTKVGIHELHKQGKLGAILLWMLFEGVLGVSKFFTRVSLDDDSNDSFSEIYLGMRESKLVFYLGDGKLSADFKEGVSNSIELLGSCINIQNDIFTSDEGMYENLSYGYFKQKLDSFMNHKTRKWEEVILEFTIFTGYNSSGIKAIEGGTHSKIEEIVRQLYIKESGSNHDYIHDEINSFMKNNNIIINWFILPFNDISEFENLILQEFA